MLMTWRRCRPPSGCRRRCRRPSRRRGPGSAVHSRPRGSAPSPAARWQAQVTPATPAPLLVAQAMVPATCVPWPTSSCGCASRTVQSPSKCVPGGGEARARSTRSGRGAAARRARDDRGRCRYRRRDDDCRTADVTSQAAGQLMRVRPHWPGNVGSSGTMEASRQRLGSAASTASTGTARWPRRRRRRPPRVVRGR